MVLAAMAPGSDFPPLRGEGLPKAREPLELVCGASVSRYASWLLPRVLWALQHCCLDILTIAVERFDAQPAFEALTISVGLETAGTSMIL